MSYSHYETKSTDELLVIYIFQLNTCYLGWVSSKDSIELNILTNILFDRGLKESLDSLHEVFRRLVGCSDIIEGLTKEPFNLAYITPCLEHTSRKSKTGNPK